LLSTDNAITRELIDDEKMLSEINKRFKELLDSAKAVDNNADGVVKSESDVKFSYGDYISSLDLAHYPRNWSDFLQAFTRNSNWVQPNSNEGIVFYLAGDYYFVEVRTDERGTKQGVIHNKVPHGALSDEKLKEAKHEFIAEINGNRENIFDGIKSMRSQRGSINRMVGGVDRRGKGKGGGSLYGESADNEAGANDGYDRNRETEERLKRYKSAAEELIKQYKLASLQDLRDAFSNALISIEEHFGAAAYFILTDPSDNSAGVKFQRSLETVEEMDKADLLKRKKERFLSFL